RAVVRRLLVRARVLIPKAADDELVRAATDGLCQDGKSRLLDPLDVAEVEGEVAHALADQTRNRGGAFAVQLAAEAEDDAAVFDRRNHLQHAVSLCGVGE